MKNFAARRSVNILFVGLISAVGTASIAVAATLDTPTLACGASSATSTEVVLCAGRSGAAAGFSIQWMAKEDYDAFGWPSGECTAGELGCPVSFCKASFSGQPCRRGQCLNRFSLDSNQCTTVEIGDLFDEEVGLSSSCFEEL